MLKETRKLFNKWMSSCFVYSGRLVRYLIRTHKIFFKSILFRVSVWIEMNCFIGRSTLLRSCSVSPRIHHTPPEAFSPVPRPRPGFLRQVIVLPRPRLPTVSVQQVQRFRIFGRRRYIRGTRRSKLESLLLMCFVLRHGELRFVYGRAEDEVRGRIVVFSGTVLL